MRARHAIVSRPAWRSVRGGTTAQEGECGRSGLDAEEPADYNGGIGFAEERAWKRGGNGPVVKC